MFQAGCIGLTLPQVAQMLGPGDFRRRSEVGDLGGFELDGVVAVEAFTAAAVAPEGVKVGVKEGLRVGLGV